MIRVVKVGGSLFDLPRLPKRLPAWLAAQSPAHHVLLAGGGPLVDRVRAWHVARPIDDAAAHWMCVDLMTVTAHVLHAWLPEMGLIDDVRLLRDRARAPGATVFAPAPWLRYGEPRLPGTRLPANWETTSDAVAGRLAVALRARELVLLKSALPAASGSIELNDLAASGYVDPVIVQMHAELPPTRLVNFRTDPPMEVRMPPG